jgi:predicted Fe-Mo cluster-binding NifX family protein
VRDRLELLMDLNGTHFKSLGERALEDFERRTIDVMVVHRDDRVQTFLLKFYEETTNLKLKQYIAKYLSAGRSEG